MKNITLLLCALFVAGCANLIPEKYDAVEFNRLAELNVMVKNEVQQSPVWCHPAELNVIDYQSTVLAVYAQHTLKPRIAEIYAEINSLARELNRRQEPSEAYCRIKRKNIGELTDQALAVFGNRSKK